MSYGVRRPGQQPSSDPNDERIQKEKIIEEVRALNAQLVLAAEFGRRIEEKGGQGYWIEHQEEYEALKKEFLEKNPDEKWKLAFSEGGISYYLSELERLFTSYLLYLSEHEAEMKELFANINFEFSFQDFEQDLERRKENLVQLHGVVQDYDWEKEFHERLREAGEHK